jgi:disulfide bond formation protein DsbB
VSLASTSNEIAGEVVKASPPVAVVGASFIGMALQDWLIAATIFYTITQTVMLIRKLVKDVRGSRTGGNT